MGIRSLTKEAWVKSVPEKMPNGTANTHVTHVILFRVPHSSAQHGRTGPFPSPGCSGITRVLQPSSGEMPPFAASAFPNISFRQVKSVLIEIYLETEIW